MRDDGNDGMAFAIGGIGEAGANVLVGQIGEVVDDLGPAHAGGNPAQHIADGNAQAAHAGASAPLARLQGDDVPIIHKRKFSSIDS